MIVEKKIKTGEVEINYAEGPDSGPPLLLLHGNSWRWQSFLSMIPVLSQRWHVFAPDFRGHGNSGRSAEPYSLDVYLEDTLAFIDNVINEPVTIFGHSMGAAITLLIASKIPEKIKGIILGDMTIDSSILLQQMQAIIGSGLVTQWREWAGEDISNLELLKKMMKHQIKLPDTEETIPWSEAPDSIPWILFLAQNLCKLDPEVLNGASDIEVFKEGWKLYDSNVFLSKIRCPVLLLQADPKLGGMMTDECVKLTKENIEIIVHKKLDGVGHGLFYSNPSAILQTVIDFLELTKK